MKKILFMIAMAIATNFSYGQAVIGTLNTNHLDFWSDNQPRGRLTDDGKFLFGLTAAPSGTTFSSATAGVCNGDFLVLGSSSSGHFYIDYSHELRSSVYNYGSSLYNAGYYASILLNDATNAYSIPDYNTTGGYPGGAMFIQGFTNGSAINMQYKGGAVVVGNGVVKTGYSPSDNLKDAVGVSDALFTIRGANYANGYAAAIDKVTTSPFTVTNDNYTLLASSGSSTIVLPVSGISRGRIFVIKNVTSSSITVNVSGSGGGSGPYIDGNTNVTISNPQSIMVQFDGTDYFIISSN